MSDYPVGHETEAQINGIKEYGLFVDFGLKGTDLIHKTKLINKIGDVPI